MKIIIVQLMNFPHWIDFEAMIQLDVEAGSSLEIDREMMEESIG